MPYDDIVVPVSTAPRRRGPAPRFTREQLVDAALSVVESQGFAALSLRSVARQLEVGPMTLYTYVSSSDELASLAVDRLVELMIGDTAWPSGWQDALRVFADKLFALVDAHPAMVEAYQRGMLRQGRASQVAKGVLDQLSADGMTPEQAREAYLAVHSLVLGFALARAGGPRARLGTQGSGELDRDLLMRIVERILPGLAP
jgi:AcrR family transcriptional regulator